MAHDGLDRYLAREARRLGLGPATLDGADEASLRAMCEVVLAELAARGLLPDREDREPGCHAAPRPRGD